MADVGLGRAVGHAQLTLDVAGGLVLGKEEQHLLLALGEAMGASELGAAASAGVAHGSAIEVVALLVEHDTPASRRAALREDKPGTHRCRRDDDCRDGPAVRERLDKTARHHRKHADAALDAEDPDGAHPVAVAQRPDHRHDEYLRRAVAHAHEKARPKRADRADEAQHERHHHERREPHRVEAAELDAPPEQDDSHNHAGRGRNEAESRMRAGDGVGVGFLQTKGEGVHAHEHRRFPRKAKTSHGRMRELLRLQRLEGAAQHRQGDERQGARPYGEPGRGEPLERPDDRSAYKLAERVVQRDAHGAEAAVQLAPQQDGDCNTRTADH